MPTRSAVEDAHLQQGEVERLRSEVTVSAVKSAVVHLGGIRDGRKALILVSEGLRGIQRDLTNLTTDLVRAANDNNTAIYAIDPRGLTQQRFPSAWEPIASETGGNFYRSNDLEHAFRQVVTESSGFYLLGYAPTDGRQDGKFHKIRVRVKPSGLEVRARNGYWAPNAVDVERAKAKAEAAVVPPDMVRALSELPGSTARRTIDFWAGARLEDGKTAVRLAWVPRPSAGPGAAKPAVVSAVVTKAETKIYEGPVTSSGVSFPAPSGALKVTYTVLDAANEIVDRDARTIDVPDLAGTALSVIDAGALPRAERARVPGARSRSECHAVCRPRVRAHRPPADSFRGDRSCGRDRNGDGTSLQPVGQGSGRVADRAARVGRRSLRDRSAALDRGAWRLPRRDFGRRRQRTRADPRPRPHRSLGKSANERAPASAPKALRRGLAVALAEADSQ